MPFVIIDVIIDSAFKLVNSFFFFYKGLTVSSQGTQGNIRKNKKPKQSFLSKFLWEMGGPFKVLKPYFTP